MKKSVERSGKGWGGEEVVVSEGGGCEWGLSWLWMRMMVVSEDYGCKWRCLLWVKELDVNEEKTETCDPGEHDSVLMEVDKLSSSWEGGREREGEGGREGEVTGYTTIVSICGNTLRLLPLL